jgi:2-polyprenyl-3-methyl-5-hydroxy-6-metoxy-1,4-benzoquinol methylase
MRYEEKRLDVDSLKAVQAKNAAWWNNNPMSYDWRGENPHAPHSAEWFEWLDRRFVHAARFFATDQVPFDRLIPFRELRGKRVLEIGCGMGLHSELIARSGAHLTAIDMTPAAVEATRARLRLRGLDARIEQMDAETLAPAFGQFDFVWSWGVIHHSARTAFIVRKISEILAPDGVFKGMVYHRDGSAFWIALVKEWLLKLRLRHSVDEALWRSTDGFSARFYSVDQWKDILLAFFQEANCFVTGQVVDALPLPGRLRRMVEPRVSTKWVTEALARTGTFVVFEARRPIGTPA